jgi:hypothetical protein
MNALNANFCESGKVKPSRLVVADNMHSTRCKYISKVGVS